ncbi:feather keratin Cos1-1/Cos1-3/Cos2-1-like isoform X1 [Vidua macroura]|uniref:feather keratin Cos1-1/Cos1-3/Cos2-1-like isoform X1 n=1 Tax=Vidua macroura TaxID=187451 RepID=UPI0023A7C16E|nr:feather keratin Cos1-1/Cos1-3/Cos2-1-like isoform X1 [Vidua macroura]
MLVAGDGWEEGALFQQKGIHGAQPQGDVPGRICTGRGVTKCPSASRDISNTATSVPEMGCDQSLHRGLKATVLGAIAELCLLHREMSCCRPCPPRPCGPCGPTPLASSCSEPCLARCADSTVYIEPSPVVVTLPGPILTSFPQSTAVGSSLSAAVGSSLSTSGVPISSGGSLGLGGSGLCLPFPRCGQIC